MNLEGLRNDLATKQDAVSRAMDKKLLQPCRGCPNLSTSTKVTGGFVLSCHLERDGSQLASPANELPENGPSAGRVAKALLVTKALLKEASDQPVDKEARKFRDKVEVADEDCPIMANVIDQLVDADAENVIDLNPPSPLVSYDELKHAVGYDQYPE